MKKVTLEMAKRIMEDGNFDGFEEIIGNLKEAIEKAKESDMSLEEFFGSELKMIEGISDEDVYKMGCLFVLTLAMMCDEETFRYVLEELTKEKEETEEVVE